MWYLLEDFLEQSLVMKAFIGWGWLSVLIMVASIVVTAPELLPEEQHADAAATESVAR
jgi:hypothetical protein